MAYNNNGGKDNALRFFREQNEARIKRFRDGGSRISTSDMSKKEERKVRREANKERRQENVNTALGIGWGLVAGSQLPKTVKKTLERFK